MFVSIYVAFVCPYRDASSRYDGQKEKPDTRNFQRGFAEQRRVYLVGGGMKKVTQVARKGNF